MDFLFFYGKNMGSYKLTVELSEEHFLVAAKIATFSRATIQNVCSRILNDHISKHPDMALRSDGSLSKAMDVIFQDTLNRLPNPAKEYFSNRKPAAGKWDGYFVPGSKIRPLFNGMSAQMVNHNMKMMGYWPTVQRRDGEIARGYWIKDIDQITPDGVNMVNPPDDLSFL